MKTSNILLLTLLLLFFGSFLLMGWNAEATITKTNVNQRFDKNLEIMFNFSVVVAEEGTSFSIIQDSTPTNYYLTGTTVNSKLFPPVYEIRNDTLFVKQTPNVECEVSFHCPKIISYIGKKKSEVSLITDYTEEYQTIKLNHAKFEYKNSETSINKDSLKVDKKGFVLKEPASDIKITANQSEIRFLSSKNVYNLNLNLNDSYFYINNQGEPFYINTITGDIKNNSRVDLNKSYTNILKIDIKGDKTSSFYRATY
jgi:hypothetical protein